MSRHDLSWRERAYRPGDEEALTDLFARVFGRSMTPEEWRWKLRTLPSPVENIALAVDSGDTPVSQVAGIPRRIQLGDLERTAMVVVDTMTATPYRRRGILTALFSRLLERWRGAGVAVVLGLPNERWGSRTRALGWRPLGGLRWRIRPLRPEAIVARRIGLPAMARVSLLGSLWNRWCDRGAAHRTSVRELRKADEALDILEGRRAVSRTAGLIRSSRWIAWRYLDHPTDPYTVLLAEDEGGPVGFAAFRVREEEGRRVGWIAEVSAMAGPAAGALLREISRRLRKGGVETVATLSLPDTPLDGTLRRSGFNFSWGTFPVHVIILDPGLEARGLPGPAEWQLAGGDFDVV